MTTGVGEVLYREDLMAEYAIKEVNGRYMVIREDSMRSVHETEVGAWGWIDADVDQRMLRRPGAPGRPYKKMPKNYGEW